ncbi:MAG: hypothetical protein Q9219_001651 [cf. Caloplaca sp. 3 TL-2023]
MPVSTRHKAALRLAEGIPPSPQNEDDIPRELRAPPRRQKRAPRSKRPTSAPEHQGDSASTHDQATTSQALREGNAGGYVVQSSSSEPQDSLSQPLVPSTPTPQSKTDLSTQEPSCSTTGTAIAGEHPASVLNNTTLQDICLSPVPTPSTPQIKNPMICPSTPKSTLNDAQGGQRSGTQSTASRSLSFHEDQKPVPNPSPSTMHDSFRANGLAMHIASHPSPSAQGIRSLNLDDLKSELSQNSQSCSITLHLTGNKQVRIPKVSSTAMEMIESILRNDHFAEEQDLLTSEGIVAEAATPAIVEADKQIQSSNKRKRDDGSEDTRSTQRRRIESTGTPSKSIASTPTPFKLRSRFRTMGSSLGQAKTPVIDPQQSLSHAATPKVNGSSLSYDQEGTLQLINNSGGHQRSHSKGQNSTIIGSDDEGESEGILLFPNLASANKAMLRSPTRQKDNNSVEDSDALSEPDSPDVHGTPSGGPQQSSGEPSTPMAETPQTGSWGFGSLFRTARRFIPGIRQRQAPLAVPQTIRPAGHAPAVARDEDISISQRGAQTEPRRLNHRGNLGNMDSGTDFAKRLRDSQSANQKSFRTKGKVEELKKIRAEKEKIKAEWEKLAEERRITEEERKITEQQKKDVEDAHRAAYTNQQPGSKRRLRLSPRIIPNPKGVSYGLDPAYFDTSDEEEPPSPTHFPMRKARRLRGPNKSQPAKNKGLDRQNVPLFEGSQDQAGTSATQYRGSHFSDSPPNVFNVSTTHSSEESSTSRDLASRMEDPNFNRMGHFQVPLSPSSSEEDETEAATEETSPESQTVKHSFSQPSKTDNISSQSEKQSGAMPSSTLASVAPSQPPKTPAAKGLRAFHPAKDSDASKTLEKSRQTLRAELLKKGGKSVLSPKDIANSSMKSQLFGKTSRTPIPDFSAPSRATGGQQETSKEQSLFVQADEGEGLESSPSFKSGDNAGQVGKSITPPAAADEIQSRASSSHATSKSIKPGSAKILPGTDGKPSKLPTYEEYKEQIDAETRDIIESCWGAEDDKVAVDAFQADWKAHRASEQDGGALDRSDEDRSLDYLFEGEEPDEAFYQTLLEELEKDNRLAREEANAAPSAAPSEMGKITASDPDVEAFVDSQWTEDDETYASDEFRNNYAAFEGSGDEATDKPLPAKVVI